MTTQPNRLLSGEKDSFRGKMVQLAAVFVFSFSLTLLYLAMRGVMFLGGYVSSGGPYLITNPAPEWTWVMNLAILSTIGSLTAGISILKKQKGVTLLYLFWPSLCFALAWNFLDFGLGLQGWPGIHWFDVVVGLVLIFIGAIPLMVIFLDHRRKIREKCRVKLTAADVSRACTQILCALMAGFLAVLFFQLLQ